MIIATKVDRLMTMIVERSN